MDETLPTYQERLDAARERLNAALDPQTEQEKVIVDWLGMWEIETLSSIAEMVERVGRHAYDRGFAERPQ